MLYIIIIWEKIYQIFLYITSWENKNFMSFKCYIRNRRTWKTCILCFPMMYVIYHIMIEKNCQVCLIYKIMIGKSAYILCASYLNFFGRNTVKCTSSHNLIYQIIIIRNLADEVCIVLNIMEKICPKFVLYLTSWDSLLCFTGTSHCKMSVWFLVPGISV